VDDARGERRRGDPEGRSPVAESFHSRQWRGVGSSRWWRARGKERLQEARVSAKGAAVGAQGRFYRRGGGEGRRPK
jgi:hypothetical protein